MSTARVKQDGSSPPPFILSSLRFCRSRDVSIDKSASQVVDAIGAGAIIAAIIGYLPIIAAAVALVWYVIQIWESRTIQHWVENRRMVRKAKKVARLKARERVIVAQLEALEALRQARVDARDKVEVARVEAAKLAAIETADAELKDPS